MREAALVVGEVLSTTPLCPAGHLPLKGGDVRQDRGGSLKMTRRPVPLVNRRNARRIRKTLTEAELKLWNELRAHRLMGLPFRRQMPISGYIVDFACPSKKLIVEVDGSQHGNEEGARTDLIRDEKLKSLGWTILSFWNDDVLRDIDNVCRHIVIAAGLMAEDAGQQAAANIATMELHP